MRNILAVTCLFLSGCSTFGSKAPVYHDVPEAYLQKCDVPPLPDNNGEMAEAYLGAAQCAIQGNTDKDRIRDLHEPADGR